MTRSIIKFAALLCAMLSFNTFAADAALSVDGAYVRLAPPGAQATGAFMILKNSGNEDHKLVKAESPAAKLVQLHTHVNENGVMKMRQVESIEIKAHSQTELKPGGFHVMLIDLTAALKDGDNVSFTLTFDDGSTASVTAPVRKQAMSMPAGKAMNHGDMAQ